MSMDVSFRPDAATRFHARGYIYESTGDLYATVRTGEIDIAVTSENFKHLIRLRDAIDIALAQAHHAQQDADLADLAQQPVQAAS
ncbi:MAG: hypothetical protein ACTHMS_23450 [Jatrophihabitans sp.]|uniref:hypothetical protein n=1 Tax=Jatrophihabitans sp. TaxID=1932789 RepID=UPI003F7F7FBE